MSSLCEVLEALYIRFLNRLYSDILGRFSFILKRLQRIIVLRIYSLFFGGFGKTSRSDNILEDSLISFPGFLEMIRFFWI